MSGPKEEKPPAPTGGNKTTNLPHFTTKAAATDSALSEIRKRIQDIDLPEESGGAWRTAFQFARVAQGVLSRHRLTVKNLAAGIGPVAEEFALEAGLDPELFLEEVAARWDKVRTPDGVDLVAEAARLARNNPLPALPGDWLTPRLKRDSQMTVAICGRLAARGEVFFLSCRSLADVLGCDHYRAARILKDLCTRGHLETVKAGTQHAATRYRLPCDRDTRDTRDNGDNGDNGVSRENRYNRGTRREQSHDAGGVAGVCDSHEFEL